MEEKVYRTELTPVSFWNVVLPYFQIKQQSYTESGVTPTESLLNVCTD